MFTRYLRLTGVAAAVSFATACQTDSPSNAELVTGVPLGAVTTTRTGTTVSLKVRDSVALKTVSLKRSIRWSTSNPSVATVSRNGTVVGVAEGTAVITASSTTAFERTTIGVSGTTTLTPTVTSLSLNPATVQLTAGGSQQFNVSAGWSDGSTTVPAMTYTATGGSISSSGLYSAGALAGTFMVVASCTCGLTDTSVISIAAVQAPQLVSLRISPKTISVAGGASVQFQTTAMWSTGDVTLPPISYSVLNGGSVNSATGLFVAPATSGTYRVVVSHSGGSVRDTATVSVAGTSTDGGATPAPTSFTRNLPQNVGLQQFFDSRFGNMLNNQLNADSIGYVWDGRNAIDPTAPYGQNVFETFYPGGSFGGGGGGAQIFSSQGKAWRRLYFSLMMWVPANYSTHSNEEKFFYPLIRTGSSVSGYNLAWWPKWSANAPEMTWKFQPRPGYSEVSTTGASVPKGRWTNVEVFMQINNVGAADGVLKIWIDGAVSIDRSNIIFSEGAVQGVFEGIRFDGTRGGGYSDTPTPPEGQIRRYNRLAFFASN